MSDKIEVLPAIVEGISSVATRESLPDEWCGIGGRAKGRPKSKPVKEVVNNTAKALSLWMKGLNQNEIATQLGCDKNTVSVLLTPFKNMARTWTNEALEAYREQKLNILEATEATLLDSINSPDKLEKASLNNAAYALQQVHIVKRLESNQSTENVNVNIQEIKRDRYK